MKVEMKRSTFILCIILVLLMLCAFFLVGGFCGFALDQFITKATTKPTHINSIAIQQQIQTMSELATSKVAYQGMISYEEGNYTFIDKKSYNMIYQSEVKAGVDLSKATVKVNEKAKTITIDIPDPEILSVYVDPSKTQFYDQHYSLSNLPDSSTGTEAMQMAEKDSLDNIDQQALLSAAKKQAEDVVSGLVEIGVPEDYEIIIK